MKDLLFVTKNKNKLIEIKNYLNKSFNVLSLDDISLDIDIEEPYETIKENSIHKALFFQKRTKLDCITEDSGLEVECLNNQPGARSARYSGDHKSDIDNINLLLNNMKNMSNRNARFLSVFTLIDKNGYKCFEGEMKGEIIFSPKGTNGFGYDPIFIAKNSQYTNAELTLEQKNKISHRAKALNKLVDYLHNKK